MRRLSLISLLLLTGTFLFADIPSKQDISRFLDDLNKPITLTINGGNFSSSIYLAGIPHFLIESGVTGLGFTIRNPEGAGELKSAIPMFHLKASAGVFKGFTLATSWKGFLGIENGIKGCGFPLLGSLGKYKEKYPYIFSWVTKLNLIRDIEFIPAVSFSFEYSQLFDAKFKFYDTQTKDKASCSFDFSSLYYHFDIRERFKLIDFYGGVGWLSPTLKADYVINEDGGSLSSKPGTLNKLYFGITVPIELIDVNLELGKSQSYGFYGIALGFRM